MFSRHIRGQLARYLDGRLSLPERQRMDQHLAVCGLCRTEREQIRNGMSMLHHLPPAQAPDAIWKAIEAAIPQRRDRVFFTRRWLPAFAAFAIVAVAGAAYWTLAHRRQTGWEVVRIQGSPAIGQKPVHQVSGVESGDWIETDASSIARIKVGQIGSVEVGPNSRLRIAATRPLEHRLTLSRGEIHAKIWAPPKLFFVDTASATAEDLGCEYSLKTDEHGSGQLQVTLGWVSFQWKGQESLVPAGASCRTRPHAGPGVPYFDDAPEDLKNAVESFATGENSLDVILRVARVRDTLTLWHLLSRVGLPDRERVYDRIAALSPVPSDVSREKALQLDPATLARWREALAWTW
jgi:hypothetical protein